MTEPRVSDLNVPPDAHRARSWSWRQRAGNGLLLLIVAVGCYSLGRYSAARQIEDYKTRNAQITSDNGKLSVDSKNQALQIANLQDQLKDTKSKLAEVLNPARNLEIKANDSKPVSIAQMEIGMVGTPTNESVTININGTKHSASAGDVVSVDFICRVQVVSFDVLKSSANVNSTCIVKP